MSRGLQPAAQPHSRTAAQPHSRTAAPPHSRTAAQPHSIRDDIYKEDD